MRNRQRQATRDAIRERQIGVTIAARLTRGELHAADDFAAELDRDAQHTEQSQLPHDAPAQRIQREGRPCGLRRTGREQQGSQGVAVTRMVHLQADQIVEVRGAAQLFRNDHVAWIFRAALGKGMHADHVTPRGKQIHAHEVVRQDLACDFRNAREDLAEVESRRQSFQQRTDDVR